MAQKINIPQQNQPFRRQASLGGNVSFRDLGNEEDNNFITLAKVTKVYYKQGRIDFKLSNTNIVTQEVAGNHSVGSAPIPVDFFGHKPDGTVFGHYRPIKIGDVVAIAYLNGHKSSPIVIGVYPDNAQAYEAISPTMYADGDDNDSGVANDVLSEQKIHPSMQIEYRSGSGAIAKALNGHSFLAIDDEVSHDYNQLWQNYNTVGFFSQNGKIVNPLKEKAGDWTLIHEDNPDASNADRHRTRFFVSKRGELQIVFMDNTSEGDVLVMEGAQHKGFTMTQYYDTPKVKAGDMSDNVYNPNLAASPQYVRFNLGGEGKEASIEASSLKASILQSTQLAVRTDGVYLNGKLLVSGDREFSSESLIEQAIENSPYLKGTFKGFNDSVEKVTQGIKDVADNLDSVEETFDQRVNDLKKLNQDNQDLINQVSKDSQDAINQSNKDNKSLIDQATQEAKDYTDQGIKGANQYTDAGIKNANAYTDQGIKGANQYTDSGIKNANAYTDSGIQGAKDYTDSTSRGDREYTDGKFSDADKSIKELQKEQDAKIYNLSQDLHNSVDGIPTQISSTKEWVTQYVDQSNQNLIKTTNESIEDASLKTNQQVDKKIADIGDTVRQAVDTANSVSQAAQKAGENATKSANIVQNNINDMRDNMATYLRDSKDNQGSGDKNSDGTFKNKSNMWGKILDGVYLDGNTYATHMTADVLEAGTLNGNNMTFKNVLFDEGLGNHISANIIDTGTLNAVTIKAGSITADKINSPELAVITKRLGDIEAGSISIGKMKKGTGNTKNQPFDPTVTKTFDVKKVFNTVTQEQDPINVTEIPSNFWEDVAGRTVALTVDVDIENYLAHPISVSGDGPLCGVRFALSQGSKVNNHDFQVNTRGILDKTNTTMQLVGSIDVPSDCTGGTTLVYGNIRAGKITIGGFTFEYSNPDYDNADDAFRVDRNGHVTANSVDIGPGGLSISDEHGNQTTHIDSKGTLITNNIIINGGIFKKGHIYASDDPNSGVQIDGLDADNPDMYTPAKKAFLKGEIKKLDSAAEAAIDYGKNTGVNYSGIESAKEAMDNGLAGLLADMTTTTEFDHNKVIELEQALQDAINAFHNRANSDIIAKIGTTANGKNAIYRGTEEPQNPHTNDIWLQILNDGTYNIRVWDGNQWINPGLADIKAVSDSVSTLPRSYYSSTQPSGTDYKDGDIWYKTSTNTTNNTVVYTAFKWNHNTDTWDPMLDATSSRNYIGSAPANPINGDFWMDNTTLKQYQNGVWKTIPTQGPQGIPGAKGADGKTYYTWIKYATDSSGSNISDFPTGMSYIGIAYNKESPTESSTATDYKWTKIKGDDGIPGKPGADGKTSYFHIAYANSSDGKKEFYIGSGVNLLHGTADFSGDWLNRDTEWDRASEKYNGLTVYKVHQVQDWCGLSQYYKVESGETYTFSAYARYSSGTGASRIYLGLNTDPENGLNASIVSPAAKQYSFDNNWKRVEITFTVTKAGYIKPRLERTNNNKNVLEVCGFKLEKGSVATPWSPAPSEVHPLYMGTYTDYTRDGSTDPNRYTWVTMFDSTKKRNFTSQPTTPYAVGDTWTESGATYFCTTARDSGAFRHDDWTMQQLTIHSLDSNIQTNLKNNVKTNESYKGVTLNDSGLTATAGSTSVAMNSNDGFLINNTSGQVFHVGTDGNLTMKGDITAGNISGVNFTGKNLTLNNSLQVINGSISADNGNVVLDKQGLSIKGASLSISDSSGNQTTYVDQYGTFVTNKGTFTGSVTANKLIIPEGSHAEINVAGKFMVKPTGDVIAKSFTSTNGTINYGTINGTTISAAHIKGGTINGSRFETNAYAQNYESKPPYAGYGTESGSLVSLGSWDDSGLVIRNNAIDLQKTRSWSNTDGTHDLLKWLTYPHNHVTGADNYMFMSNTGEDFQTLSGYEVIDAHNNNFPNHMFIPLLIVNNRKDLQSLDIDYYIRTNTDANVYMVSWCTDLDKSITVDSYGLPKVTGMSTPPDSFPNEYSLINKASMHRANDSIQLFSDSIDIGSTGSKNIGVGLWVEKVGFTGDSLKRTYIAGGSLAQVGIDHSWNLANYFHVHHQRTTITNNANFIQESYDESGASRDIIMHNGQLQLTNSKGPNVSTNTFRVDGSGISFSDNELAMNSAGSNQKIAFLGNGKQGIYFDSYGNIQGLGGSAYWRIKNKNGNSLVDFPMNENYPITFNKRAILHTGGESDITTTWVAASSLFYGAHLPAIGRSDWWNIGAQSGMIAIANGSMYYFSGHQYWNFTWGPSGPSGDSISWGTGSD